MAVYTNVTSDHLDRHGSLEAYRRVKRRLAELVDPDGALVLNVEDPVVASYADIGQARSIPYRRGEPLPGGLGVVDGWIVADGVERLALAGRDGGATAIGGPIMPVDELAIPARTTSRTRSPRSRSGLVFGLDPRRDPRGGRGVHRRRAPARAGGRRSTASASSTTRRGRSRTRSSPRCARSNRRSSHRRRSRQGNRPVGPRRRSSPSARPRRSSSARAAPTLEAAFRAAGLRDHGACRRPRCRGAARRRARPCGRSPRILPAP